jgi:arylsulfatase
MVPRAARPNVLFLMADQFRYDGIRANGNRRIQTPHLDALAEQSANCSQFFVQAPVCVPSRVSYFTGRYPHSHKNRVNYTPCDPREIFLQRMLHDAGYQTGSVGKLHYYPPTASHARETGFDSVLLHDGVEATDPYSDYVRWRRDHDPQASVPYNALAPSVPAGGNPFRSAIPYEFTPTHWTGEETCRMLRRFCASRQPFFLFSSFFKPHSPFGVPAPFDAMYDGVDFPLPRRVTLEDIQKLPLPLQKLILRAPEYKTDSERLQWIYRSYYAAVAMVDREIGSILQVLNESGRADDTIVIFGTDHGAQLLEHGLMDKNVFFEASEHVPFLIRYPGRIHSARCAELLQSVDVLPTILDLCGVPVAERVQGRSFANLVLGNRSSYVARDLVFSENIIPEVITTKTLNMPFVRGKGIAGIPHPDAKMVRTSRWKYNYYPRNGAELFDLHNDPNEENNLAGDPRQAPILSELRSAMLDWMITADENDQISPRWLLS